MAIFIGTILAIFSIAVIGYPFLKSRTQAGRKVAEPATGPDGPDLDTIYEAIRTLRLEHQLGNIPQALYQEQLDAYRVQAALALKHQAEAQDEDWSLEQEILLARSNLTQVNGHARPCSNCGALVSAAVAQCPECNAGLDRSDHVASEGPET